jgi:hypothetical protein
VMGLLLAYRQYLLTGNIERFRTSECTFRTTSL